MSGRSHSRRGALLLAVALTVARGSLAQAREVTPKVPPPAKIDKMASEVTILDGKAITQEMRKARGHGLFVHLWASWCGPCLDELPLVEAFARLVRERGATFLSVSLDDVRRGAHVADVLRRQAPGLTPFVARFDDPDRFMSLFSPRWEGAIPALFGYDSDGRLKGSVVGEVEPEDLVQLLAEIAPRSGARVAPADDESQTAAPGPAAPRSRP